MNLKEYCKRIDLPEPVAEQVIAERENCTEEVWLQLMVVLRDAMEALETDRLENSSSERNDLETLKKMLAPDEHGIKMLMVMLNQAMLTSTGYRMLHLPDTIYFDTMKCFSRFVREHKDSYGFYGFDRDFWTIRQLSMKLFRIGALEYELVKRKTSASKASKEIHIHIPSDASLQKEACTASLQAAGEFMKTYYPDYENAPYLCHSWLLAPALADLLPPASHILAFQSLFTIEEADPDDQEYIQWIFKNPKLSRKELPETTSLQRKVKQMMMDGHNLGSARGRFTPANP